MSDLLFRGSIVFEYRLSEYENVNASMSNEELIDYFIDAMLEDVIAQSYSDLRPCIEMDFEEVL